MYGEVWKWAGKFRTSEKNLGVPHYLISTELKRLLDDAQYWIFNAIFSPDEIAIRFKHRLVCIHCFPNGNGRHSRVMADLIIEKIFSLPLFTWGHSPLSEHDSARAKYLAALKKADLHDYQELMDFARS